MMPYWLYLQGMSWNKARRKCDYYYEPSMIVEGEVLPQRGKVDSVENIMVKNLRATHFRSLLKRNPGLDSLFDYHMIKTNHLKTSLEPKKYTEVKIVCKILSNYPSEFRDDLSYGIHPKRSIAHYIELEKGSRHINEHY